MRAALLLASVFALAACNIDADAEPNEGAASGGGTQRSYNLTGFNSVSLTGSQDVIVQVGAAHSVRAQGDADTLDRLKIEVEGSSLKIGMKKGNWTKLVGRSSPTTIYVTLPAIEAAAVTGSGDMRIDRIEGNGFSASVTGSGDLEIAAMRVKEANFSVTGSGGVRATGSAEAASSSVTGSGGVDIGGLETGTASVQVMGSGEVRARVMRQASVSMMGSGDVNISGPAKCSVNKKGSGDVRCGG